jgi:hypothetical protein
MEELQDQVYKVNNILRQFRSQAQRVWAIWKVKSSELLTKQAMRQQISFRITVVQEFAIIQNSKN